MLFQYFAGSVFKFTPPEIVIFFIVAFVVLGTIVGSIIFTGKKLLDRFRKGSGSNKISFGKAILIGIGLVIAIILLFFVIPTKIKDSNWNKKQQSCAKQVGYRSPAEDNTEHENGDSHAAYRACLGF